MVAVIRIRVHLWMCTCLSYLSVMDVARLAEAARGGSVRVVFLADNLILHALSVSNKLASVVVSKGVQEMIAGSSQAVGEAVSSRFAVAVPT